MEIAAVISAVVAIIGAIWPIVKYYDKKSQNRFEARMNRLEENIKGQRAMDLAQEEKINKIEDKLQKIDDTLQKNEKDRLKSEIIDFHSRLANGWIAHEKDFEHIHYVRDKYHALHGNTYCDELFNEILKYERKFMSLNEHQRKEG